MVKARKQPQSPIWYKCPDCRICQSFGNAEFEGFKPGCPDCHKPMIREA